MYCSISGEIPQDPVISKRTGHLYERRIIEKYLKDDGKCPVTGEQMDNTDLLAVVAQKAVRPRPVTATSIPQMLAMFQNEWDEVMLETFTLKTHLDTTRQELSQALYQHDAACRVIARLMRERDEACAQLNALRNSGLANTPSGVGPVSNDNTPTVGAQQSSNAPSSAMEIAAPAAATAAEPSPPSVGLLDSDVLATITEKCQDLSKGRKGRKAPPNLCPRATIPTFEVSHSFTPLETTGRTKPTATVVAMSVGKQADLSVVLTGNDKVAVLSDLQTGNVLAKLTGHSKKITDVAFNSSNGSLSPYALTASADKQVKLWKPSASSPFSYNEAVTFAKHSSEVTAITIQPTGSYFVSTSSDSTWTFNDLHRGVCLSEHTSTATPDPYTSCRFHPDGLILSTGSQSGVIKIWDVRIMESVASCTDHTGAATCLDFNENGYMFASGSEDGSAIVWDLRKVKPLCKIDAPGGGSVSAVRFDSSGSYLSLGSTSGHVSVSVVKEWTQIALIEAHKASVRGLQWGELASSLVTCSLDKTVKTFRPPTSA